MYAGYARYASEGTAGPQSVFLRTARLAARSPGVRTPTRPRAGAYEKRDAVGPWRLLLLRNELRPRRERRQDRFHGRVDWSLGVLNIRLC
jgi:hypothetical protein